MNCSEVEQLLPAYLANEVTPSERKLIQNHLAACADCQNELRILAVLQTRIRESLNDKAAESAPSPQAWSRLQARLDTPTRADVPIRFVPWPRKFKQALHKGAFGMKRIAYATLAVLLLLAGLLVAVPNARAAVLEDVLGWFGYDFASPDKVVSLGANWGFSPFNPGYMPDGLVVTGTMVDDHGGEGVKTVGLCYQPDHRELGDPFVVILQHQLDAPESLPSDNQVSVGEATGSIDELPAGQTTLCLGPSPDEELVSIPEGEESTSPPSLSPSEPFSYDQVLRLTYIVDDVKFEIFGPYPEDELVRIAESMQQAGLAAEQPERP